jgi:3-oxoacyl-[acyl-carrier protein] reductase
MSLLNPAFDPAREAALVTGAGNGIGRAIAQALVGEGVRTVFADVSEERVVAAVKTSARPDLALPWIGDLANPAAREALLAHARSVLGQVTHFVHSASPPRREADHALAVSTETWAQMHAVNLEAGFHLSRELARDLIAAKSPGSFLLLTSLHAGTPRNLPHYSTAKAGWRCW